MPRTPRPASERFWKFVRKTDHCWLWTGFRTKPGYGQMSYGVKATGGCRRVYAHRVSYEIANGPIPEGFHVMHRCDNPPCVNPAHLSLGTDKDNLMDCARKGRTNKTVLSKKHVRQIRAAYEIGITQDKLARAFKVEQTTISAVIRRKTWNWLH